MVVLIRTRCQLGRNSLKTGRQFQIDFNQRLNVPHAFQVENVLNSEVLLSVQCFINWTLSPEIYHRNPQDLTMILLLLRVYVLNRLPTHQLTLDPHLKVLTIKLLIEYLASTFIKTCPNTLASLGRGCACDHGYHNRPKQPKMINIGLSHLKFSR